MEEIVCFFHVDLFSRSEDQTNPIDQQMDAECHDWAGFDLDSERVHAVV